MAKIFVDASGTQMGRVACFVAKQALLGNELFVLNTDKVVISGAKPVILGKFQELRQLNNTKPRKGPFIAKTTEKIMKRSIRCMLPDFRLGRGKIALGNIKCHSGVPPEYANEKMIKVETKLPKVFMTLEEIRKLM